MRDEQRRLAPTLGAEVRRQPRDVGAQGERQVVGRQLADDHPAHRVVDEALELGQDFANGERRRRVVRHGEGDGLSLVAEDAQVQRVAVLEAVEHAREGDGVGGPGDGRRPRGVDGHRQRGLPVARRHADRRDLVAAAQPLPVVVEHRALEDVVDVVPTRLGIPQRQRLRRVGRLEARPQDGALDELRRVVARGRIVRDGAQHRHDLVDGDGVPHAVGVRELAAVDADDLAVDQEAAARVARVDSRAHADQPRVAQQLDAADQAVRQRAERLAERVADRVALVALTQCVRVAHRQRHDVLGEGRAQPQHREVARRAGRDLRHGDLARAQPREGHVHVADAVGHDVVVGDEHVVDLELLQVRDVDHEGRAPPLAAAAEHGGLERVAQGAPREDLGAGHAVGVRGGEVRRLHRLSKGVDRTGVARDAARVPGLSVRPDALGDEHVVAVKGVPRGVAGCGRLHRLHVVGHLVLHHLDRTARGAEGLPGLLRLQCLLCALQAAERGVIAVAKRIQRGGVVLDRHCQRRLPGYYIQHDPFCPGWGKLDSSARPQGTARCVELGLNSTRSRGGVPLRWCPGTPASLPRGARSARVSYKGNAPARHTHMPCPGTCAFQGVDFRCARCGDVHRCGAGCTLRVPNRDATLICPVSGRCFDQSIATHPFQRATKRVLVDVRVASCPTTRPKRERARPRARRDAFEDLVGRLLVGAAGYVIKHYVDATFRFWQRIVDTPYGRSAKPRLRVVDVVVGVVYTMRKGLLHDGKVAFGRDHALRLPGIAVVAKRGFSKRCIRVGRNHVRFAAIEMMRRNEALPFCTPPPADEDEGGARAASTPPGLHVSVSIRFRSRT